MYRSLTVAALMLLVANITFAQDDSSGVSTSEDGATVSYDARFFAQYSPITALDMLRWIPGTSDIVPEDRYGGGGGGGRGFGSGGDQILINGKRLSGKSNDIASAVQRIQARTVERIDIIRGTASGLDVRTDGILINIILSEAADDGSGSWQVHVGDYGAPGVQPDGLVSYSQSRGQFKYLVSAEYGPYNRSSTTYLYEELWDAATGLTTERSNALIPEDQEQYQLNASGSWTFGGGDVLNLNGQFSDSLRTDDRTTVAEFPESGDIETVLEEQNRDEVEWEFGGDLVNKIGAGELKTRLIMTSEDSDRLNSVSQTSTVPGNVPSEALVTQAEKATETILRSSYAWTLSNGQSLEIGLEGALNTLEKQVRLFDRQPNGDLIEVPLTNSDSEVEEDRYELFITHVWSFGGDKVLESALNIEQSKIAQLGLDVDNSREFTYYKPRFDFRWDLNVQDQLRATLERTVSQLNFGDFVVRFDDDDDRIVGGNPNLEPEKAWDFGLTYEHRLSADRGVVSAKAFYQDIEDHIDHVEVLPDVSGPGNIGDAEVFGVEFKGSLRLDDFGLHGAVIDLVYTARDSNATDGFTGESRDRSGTPGQDIELKFRHEVAKWRLNYLFDIQWRDERFQQGFNYRQREWQDRPRFHFTTQYRATDNITVYFQGRVLDAGKQIRERDRYDGNIVDDSLLRHERRERLFEREYIIGLRGQF